ncbi:MAG: hypothetical protein R2857_04400 [Vampirovibrionales bacterium]
MVWVDGRLILDRRDTLWSQYHDDVVFASSSDGRKKAETGNIVPVPAN